MCFASAVLCVPYLALVYFTGSALWIVFSIRQKEAQRIRDWAYFTLGVLILALLFFVFATRGCSAEKILQSLPYILNPAEHENKGILYKTVDYFKELFAKDKTQTVYVILYIALFIAVKVDKSDRRILYVLTAAVLTCAVLVIIYRTGWWVINNVNLPVSLMGMVLLPLTDKKEDRTVRNLYIFGWILGACFCFGSNNGIFSIGNGLCLSSIAAAYMALCLAAKHRASGKRIAAALLLLTVLVQCGILLLFRKNYCFGEEGHQIDWYCPIIEKCAKGEIIGEPNKRNYWDDCMLDTQEVRDAEGEYVLYFSQATWLYLDDTKRCASFSAWISKYNVEKEANKLLEYWIIYPEKKPDAIYVDKKFGNSEKLTEMLNTENFAVKEKKSGYVMLRQP